jgi:hypothetical protein
VIAGAVVIFAALQYRSSKSTSEQTNQLIGAAKVSAYAAQQNALAAGNFANSARSINQGIGEAVDKLNLQAANTQNLVEQAVAQAKATNELVSAQNLASRPYVGIAGTTHGQDDKQQRFMFDVVVKNYGLRPAEHFTGHFDEYIGDEKIDTRSSPTNSTTLFPTETRHFIGDIPPPFYEDVMSGRKDLRVRVSVSYDNLEEKESYCVEQRYNAELKNFTAYGCPQ